MSLRASALIQSACRRISTLSFLLVRRFFSLSLNRPRLLLGNDGYNR